MCNTRDQWSCVSLPSRYRGEMLFDGISHQVPDIGPGRDGGVARLLRRHRRRPRTGPGPLPADEAARAGAHQAGRLPRHRLDALRQHHPGRRRAVVPRRRVPGAAHPGLHPVERRGHGDAGQHPHRGDRRAPLDVRQLGGALRGRLQPLLPWQGRRRFRRPGLLPGPRVARDLRPGLRRGPPERGAARQLPPRGRRRRPPELPPPPAPCRSSGSTRPSPWASARSRAIYQAHVNRYLHLRHLVDTSREPGLVLRGRRRDGRARVHRRTRRGGPRAPRQPHLRRQLQPAAARRAGAGQRQDHPGARGGVPRRRLERDQGDLGLALGRPAGP